MPSHQSKHWPFTWFPKGDWEAMSGDPALADKAAMALDEVKGVYDEEYVQYLVAQAECCPTSGRMHIQGYIQIKQRWTWHRVKTKIFSGALDGACFVPARGTAQQNDEYCTKEESRVPGTQPIRLGEMMSDLGETHPPGKTLDNVYEAIKAGQTMEEIVERFGFGMFVRHERALNSAMVRWGRKRKSVPKIVLLVGPSGSGKSQYVDAEYPHRYRMTFGNGGNSAWFDGYNGESVIELSEFRGQLQLSFMLDLLDRYELKVQTKGGTVQMLATVIVITSNEEPTEWYKAMDDREEKLKPLLRRIDEFGTRPLYRTANRNRVAVAAADVEPTTG